MPDKITVTASTGPVSVMTATVFQNLKSMFVDVARQVVTIVYTDSAGQTKTVEFDLYPVATVTYTVSSHLATIAMS